MIAAVAYAADSTGTPWTDIIAGAALALSIVSLIAQWSRITANVMVTVEGEPGKTAFVFENIGRAPARRVDLSFKHFEPSRPSPKFPTTGPTRSLPLAHLQSGATVRVPMLLIEGVGQNFDVQVSWTDHRPWRVKRMQTV